LVSGLKRILFRVPFVFGLENLMKDHEFVHAGGWDVDVRSRKCEAGGLNPTS